MDHSNGIAPEAAREDGRATEARPPPGIEQLWEGGQLAAGAGNRNGVLAVLARALEASPFAVVICDPAGRIEFTNARFLDLFGYTEGELIGTPVSMLSASSQDGPQLMWGLLAKGESWRDEFHGRTNDGHEFWAAIAVSPLFDHEGNLSHLLGIALDITHYKQTEAIQPLAPASPPDMLLVADIAGTILFVDRTVAGILREDAIGATVFDYIPPERHDRLRTYMREVIETRGSVTYETPSVGPHGTTAHYVVQVGPIERDGEVVALSFITTDITNIPGAKRQASADGQDSELPVRHAPRGSAQRLAGHHLPELTDRELEVLELLARGHTNREVAEQLRLSTRTIDHHVGHVLNKLHAPNRTAAVTAARQVGILPMRMGGA